MKIDDLQEKTEIEAELDRCLELELQERVYSHGEHSNPSNVIFYGRDGFGKRSRIRQWARKNDINLVEIDVSAIEDVVKKGPGVFVDPGHPNKFSSVRISNFRDALMTPRTVFLLSNYVCADDKKRNYVRSLIKDRYYDFTLQNAYNFLFAIVVALPHSMEARRYRLDMSERGCFAHYDDIEPNPLEHLRYLDRVYREELEDAKKSEDEKWIREAAGKLALAHHILRDQRFAYTTEEREKEGKKEYNIISLDESHTPLVSFVPTNYRNFKGAIDVSNGTKAGLLEQWNGCCDHAQKSVIEEILSDYKDIEI